MTRQHSLLAVLLVTVAVFSSACDQGDGNGHEGHDHDARAGDDGHGHGDDGPSHGGDDGHGHAGDGGHDHDDGPGHSEGDGHGHGDDGGHDHDDGPGHGDDDGHGHAGEDHSNAERIIRLGEAAARAARVRTQTVRRNAWLGGIRTTGEVHFDDGRVAHVSPRLEGRIHEVRIKLGDRVSPGQTLAIIDSVELGKAKAALLSARSRLGLAQQTLDREEALLGRRIASEQEVIEARAAREEAAVTLRAARDTLRVLGLSERQADSIRSDDPQAPLYMLTAPIPGKIVDLHATRGELVSRETALATVADLQNLWVWVDVHERHIARVEVGDRATVWLDAYPEDPITGELAHIRDDVDRDTRTVRARVDIPNPEERIKPGMFARVLLERQSGADAKGAALSVPPGALQRDGTESYVFVRKRANEYERRDVRVGRRSAEAAEILAGLSPGEDVVIEGGFILKSELGKAEMGHGHSH